MIVLSVYLDGGNTSFLILAILTSLPPAELVTRFQLFSYQLNDMISSIGISEHCFPSYGGTSSVV